MIVRILYAAVALSILGAFPRDAYRAAAPARAAASAPAPAGPAFAFLSADGAETTAKAAAEACPPR